MKNSCADVCNKRLLIRQYRSSFFYRLFKTPKHHRSGGGIHSTWNLSENWQWSHLDSPSVWPSQVVKIAISNQTSVRGLHGRVPQTANLVATFEGAVDMLLLWSCAPSSGFLLWLKERSHFEEECCSEETSKVVSAADALIRSLKPPKVEHNGLVWWKPQSWSLIHHWFMISTDSSFRRNTGICGRRFSFLHSEHLEATPSIITALFIGRTSSWESYLMKDSVNLFIGQQWAPSQTEEDFGKIYMFFICSFWTIQWVYRWMHLAWFPTNRIKFRGVMSTQFASNSYYSTFNDQSDRVAFMPQLDAAFSLVSDYSRCADNILLLSSISIER